MYVGAEKIEYFIIFMSFQPIRSCPEGLLKVLQKCNSLANPRFLRVLEPVGEVPSRPWRAQERTAWTDRGWRAASGR